MTGRRAVAYLERTGGAAPVLAGPAPPVQPVAAYRVFMFTDVVASTPLLAHMGDRRYVELLGEHDDVILGAVAAGEGTAVKHTGDGWFAWFASPSAAVRTALAIQQRMPVCDAAGNQIAIRVGLHAGEAVTLGTDFLGLAVTLASRVCGRAAAGEVLVSESVRLAASADGFRFRRRGRFALKGFEDRVALFEVLAPVAEPVQV